MFWRSTEFQENHRSLFSWLTLYIAWFHHFTFSYLNFVTCFKCFITLALAMIENESHWERWTRIKVRLHNQHKIHCGQVIVAPLISRNYMVNAIFQQEKKCLNKWQLEAKIIFFTMSQVKFIESIEKNRNWEMFSQFF